MAFQQEINEIKIGIEDFQIKFFVPGPSNTEDPQSGNLTVQILKDDGAIITRRYDLLTRLGDDAAGIDHRDNLADLRDYLIARLNAEVLP